MNDKLQKLVSNGMLKYFEHEEQLPSMEGDNKTRLIDKLTLIFPSGETILISTICSGCLENTSLIIE